MTTGGGIARSASEAVSSDDVADSAGVDDLDSTHPDASRRR